jgi:photosystem II stability/assembly factor-like uncharacterized protein
MFSVLKFAIKVYFFVLIAQLQLRIFELLIYSYKQYTMKVVLFVTFILCSSFSLVGQWVDADTIDVDITATYTVSFPSVSTGYASANRSVNAQETIYKTTDGALSWTNLNYSAANNPDIQNMHFTDDQNGYIAVREYIGGALDMTIKKTSDGGQNWTDVSPLNPPLGSGIAALQFLSVDSGYFAVENIVYTTFNSGQSWGADTLVTTYGNFKDVDFWDSQYGVVGGWDGTFAYTGILFITNDGGQTWSEVQIPQTYSSIVAVQRVSPTHIYALGSEFTGRYLFRSTDAGSSWDTLDLTALTANNFSNLNSLHFLDETTGYIGTDDGQLLYTTDAGLNWASVYNFGLSNNGVKSINFVANVGYAVSNMGRVAKTTVLNFVQSPSVEPLLNIYPNPVDQQLSLHFNQLNNDIQAANIQIITAQGRVAQDIDIQAESDQTVAVDCLSSLNTGVYTLSIRFDNGETILKKIVKL